MRSIPPAPGRVGATRRTIRAAVWDGFSLACLFAMASPARAQSPSVWVGETHRVVHVATDGGRPLLEIPVTSLEDLAVDAHRGVIWVGTRKAVVQYGVDGTERLRFPLRMPGGSSGWGGGDGRDGDRAHGERTVQLSLDPADGALWVGARDRLVKLSADGHEILGIEGLGHVTDVSVDIADGTVWVGLKRQVLRLSPTGARLASFHLDHGDTVRALAAEPRSHGLWLGTHRALIKVSASGRADRRIPNVRDIQDVKVNPSDASVWVVTRKTISRYAPDGRRIFAVQPCGVPHGDRDGGHGRHRDGGYGDDGGDRKGRRGGDDAEGDEDDDAVCTGNFVTHAVDASDGAGWVAWRKSLLEVGELGDLLAALGGFRQIEALDLGLPVLAVRITAPATGSVVDTPTITVSGTVSDPAATVTVNGVPATVSGRRFEAAGVSLSPGLNTVTATAASRGRFEASDTVEVTYRPPRPPLGITIDAPADGSVVATARVTVTGVVSDPSATVVVNGVQATVEGGGSPRPASRSRSAPTSSRHRRSTTPAGPRRTRSGSPPRGSTSGSRAP